MSAVPLQLFLRSKKAPLGGAAIGRLQKGTCCRPVQGREERDPATGQSMLACRGGLGYRPV